MTYLVFLLLLNQNSKAALSVLKANLVKLTAVNQNGKSLYITISA